MLGSEIFEVNKHFWSLAAINYFTAYMHYSMEC